MAEWIWKQASTLDVHLIFLCAAIENSIRRELATFRVEMIKWRKTTESEKLAAVAEGTLKLIISNQSD